MRLHRISQSDCTTGRRAQTDRADLGFGGLKNSLKKLINFENINQKEIFKVRFPFFVPKSLKADTIEIGKYVAVPKNADYAANIFKVYGKFAGKLKAKDTWFYPNSSISRTANIDTDEISFVTDKIEKGADIKAKEGWFLQGVRALEKFNIDLIHETKN